MQLTGPKILMDKNEMALTLKRLAHEIIERSKNIGSLAVIGIQTRGVPLGRRICELIRRITKTQVPFGILDITLYRDDVDSISNQPLVKETEIPFDVKDRSIILVDDVLFTGRTVRAAIDEIMDFGRPKNIRLLVLIDRGGRELPIQPDMVGKHYPTSREKETIHVHLKETDKADEVVLYKCT